jgi:hypothetical protein
LEEYLQVSTLSIYFDRIGDCEFPCDAAGAAWTFWETGGQMSERSESLPAPFGKGAGQGGGNFVSGTKAPRHQEKASDRHDFDPNLSDLIGILSACRFCGVKDFDSLGALVSWWQISCVFT